MKKPKLQSLTPAPVGDTEVSTATTPNPQTIHVSAYLFPDQFLALKQRAAMERKRLAVVIREAIDLYLNHE